MKREYRFLLKNLDCANCAAKLERAILLVDGVADATVDFMTTRLLLSVEESEFEEVFLRVQKTIENTLPEVVCESLGERKSILHEKGREEHKHHSEYGCDHREYHDECGCSHHEYHSECSCGHREHHDGCGCGHHKHHGKCSCDRNEKKRKIDIELLRILLAAILFGAALAIREVIEPIFAQILLFIPAYLTAGADVLLRAARNIVRGKVFDENFLMSLATVGAFFIGEYPEAVAVMLFYQLGELFQKRAVSKTRSAVTSLMDVRPDSAIRLVGNVETRVPSEEIAVGERILVRPGERIPLDGEVLDGESVLDMSALTGESMPRKVSRGDLVLSGSINKSGVLTVLVTKEFAESTASRILELVESASSRKAKSERFITRFARIYTPIVVILAALLAFLPPLILQESIQVWGYRALSFLVVSCPCALVISVPLAYFGGIGGASLSGVLVKGGNYLDTLTETKTVVFDKTGTLTEGRFSVSACIAYRGTEEALLETAAHVEANSSHPLAEAVLRAYGKAPDLRRVSSVEERAGEGIFAVFDGQGILLGRRTFLEKEGIETGDEEFADTAIWVAKSGELFGVIFAEDQVKVDAKESIEALSRVGVTRTVMLTGDTKEVGERIGKELGISEVVCGLLPHEKVEHVERLKRETQGRVAFVGDGINDAPVLASADVGFAMGALGSDAAIEAADVVLMTDEPKKVAEVIRLSKKNQRIVIENVVFSLLVKFGVLALIALGIANMMIAVFADVGVAVIAILNSMRMLRVKR